MSWQQQITQQLETIQAFITTLVNNAKNISLFPSASSLNGEDFFWVSQAGVDKKTTLTQILSYLQENNLFTENRYDTMSGTNPMLTQQNQQTTGKIQYVENAFGFPGIVDGDYAYFEKLSTNTQSYSDYRKLTDDEVTIIESSQSYQQKQVKIKDIDGNVDPADCENGKVLVVTDNTDITHIIFDNSYTEILAKAASLTGSQSFNFNICNTTKNSNIRATITTFTLVDGNTKYKLAISDVTDAEIDEGDILHFGLPIELGGSDTPTLQQVTDEGATTTNDVTIEGELTVGDETYSLINLNDGNNGIIESDGGSMNISNDSKDYTLSKNSGLAQITSFGENYNASTNTPTLANSDTGVKAVEYKVTVAGSQDFGAGSITFAVGDIVANDGSIWYKKVDNNQGGSSTAESTTYDNTDSSLSADNVKAGLDELDAKIDITAYYNERGATEYNGNAFYDLDSGLGLFTTGINAEFSVLRARFWDDAGDWQGIAKVYKGTTSDADPSSHTLIESKMIGAGEMNTDEDAFFEFVLSEPLTITSTDYLYLYLEKTSGTTSSLNMKRWNVQSGSEPYRKALLFKTGGGSWFFGGSTYYSTDFWLLSDIEDTKASIEKRVTTLETNSAQPFVPKLTIPANIYAVSGTQINIYYDALIMCYDNGLFTKTNVEIICAKGKTLQRMWQYDPVDGDIGTTSFTVNVYDDNGNLLEQSTSTLHTIDDVALASATNYMDVGDSITANGRITTVTHSNYTALGGTVPTFHGTQGSSPYFHEGRSGYTFDLFTGASSPFWNGSAISVTDYRTTNSINDPMDVVNIMLGVNDAFQSNVLTESQLDDIIADAETLIDAFIADSTGKIIVHLPTIAGNTRDGWASSYGADNNRMSYKINIFNIRLRLLENFDDGNYDSSVTCGSSGLVVDRYYGYGFESPDPQSSYRITDTEKRHNNGVHPEFPGSRQIADYRFAETLNFLSE